MGITVENGPWTWYLSSPIVINLALYNGLRNLIINSRISTHKKHGALGHCICIRDQRLICNRSLISYKAIAKSMLVHMRNKKLWHISKALLINVHMFEFKVVFVTKLNLYLHNLNYWQLTCPKVKFDQILWYFLWHCYYIYYTKFFLMRWLLHTWNEAKLTS